MIGAAVALVGSTATGVALAAEGTGAAAGNASLPGAERYNVDAVTTVSFMGLWAARAGDGPLCSASNSGCGPAPRRGESLDDQPVDILADKGTSVQVQCYQGSYYRINAGPDVRFGLAVTHRAGWAVWTQVQPVSKVRRCDSAL